MAYLEYLESRQLLSADLTAAFTALPAAPPNASRQLVQIRVTNAGDTAARGPLMFDLYLQGAGSVGNGTLLEHVVRGGTLAAGASRNVLFKVPLSGGLTAGNYNLVAVLDPKNRVAESNESNDTVTSPTFQVTQRNFDLVAGFATRQASLTAVTQGRVTNGMAFVTITNTGTVATPAGFPVSVQVFARPAGAVGSGSDVLLNRTTVNAPGFIAPGATRTIAVPVEFPSTLAAGNFDLAADVNGTQTLAETNAANNMFTSLTPITISATPVVTPTPTPIVITTNPPTTITPTAGNPVSQVLPTTPLGGVLPTTSLSGFLPTTNLGTSILPTTNLSTLTPAAGLSTVSIGLTGVTPLNSLGNTPLTALGNPPLNSIGTTPTGAIGLTPINPVGTAPTDSLGNVDLGVTTTSMLV